MHSIKYGRWLVELRAEHPWGDGWRSRYSQTPNNFFQSFIAGHRKELQVDKSSSCHLHQMSCVPRHWCQRFRFVTTASAGLAAGGHFALTINTGFWVQRCSSLGLSSSVNLRIWSVAGKFSRRGSLSYLLRCEETAASTSDLRFSVLSRPYVTSSCSLS